MAERNDEQPESRAEELPDADTDDSRPLSDVVDDIEDEVTEERRAEGAPGNVDDRAAARTVEPDHDAPD